ncbi:MAG TPA: leucine-rich repeat domain-containing protein, partial [Clostridia bacterium]|nr:leucine-rich repeat domain-containing protein [Clostridia bacterium]
RLNFNGYDYGGIIKIADKMIIMAHDYAPKEKLKKSEVKQYLGCDALTPIDSPAPISKIRMALEDVKNSIPDPLDLKKVMLQICFDCKQWWYPASTMEDWEALDSSALSISKKGATTVFYNKIKDRIDNKDRKGSYITRLYNNELQCPVIQYLNNSDKTFNVIVYEDSSSISAKLKMAQAYGVGGISIWSLGNIPDYNDANGKKFQLNVWTSLTSGMNGFGKAAQNADGKADFVDPAVKNAVKTKLGIQGDVRKSDLEEVYRLKLPSGTASLEDLKMLSNLEYLDAQGLKLTDIKALSGLRELRVLKLQKNKLSDVSPLASLKKLQILNITSNAITDISPLGSLNSLEEFYAANNLIANVSALKSARGLKTLYLDFNKISDITQLASFMNLYRLSMEGNSIGKVTAIAGLTKLRYLNLASNKITDISPLKDVKKLNVLYLQRNSIKDVGALKGMKSMKELSLNGNKLTDIQTLSGLKNLEKLYLMDNNLTNINALKNLSKLNTLYLRGNKIKDFSPLRANFGNLKYCDFKIK